MYLIPYSYRGRIVTSVRWVGQEIQLDLGLRAILFIPVFDLQCPVCAVLFQCCLHLIPSNGYVLQFIAVLPLVLTITDRQGPSRRTVDERSDRCEYQFDVFFILVKTI